MCASSPGKHKEATTSCASMLATPTHSLVVNVKPLISCDEKRAVCLMSRLWACRGDRMQTAHTTDWTQVTLLQPNGSAAAEQWSTMLAREERLSYFTSTNRTTSTNWNPLIRHIQSVCTNNIVCTHIFQCCPAGEGLPQAHSNYTHCGYNKVVSTQSSAVWNPFIRHIQSWQQYVLVKI